LITSAAKAGCDSQLYRSAVSAAPPHSKNFMMIPDVELKAPAKQNR
jgi:hypothetical protein